MARLSDANIKIGVGNQLSGLLSALGRGCSPDGNSIARTLFSKVGCCSSIVCLQIFLAHSPLGNGDCVEKHPFKASKGDLFIPNYSPFHALTLNVNLQRKSTLFSGFSGPDAKFVFHVFF